MPAVISYLDLGIAWVLCFNADTVVTWLYKSGSGRKEEMMMMMRIRWDK